MALKTTQLVRRGAVFLALGLLCLSIPTAARAADSIYWGNYGSDTISHANLAGGGGGEIQVGGPAPDGPYGGEGVAIDAAAGKLYWMNYDSETIEYANLDGTGAALLNTGGATVSKPAGLAIDPPAGRIYWANNGPEKTRSPTRT